ncbi:MAG: beta-ketoacyl-ACP synthase II [Bacteroidales bacterium]|jgi:3-oxoacyl-[acyl-carrier-protein] synthase II|nr:beta-ketoacyl-ACP synthase II [Bacteroidales bacterium]MCR5115468.1 beta-ketoacyl-ACP synthase II [Bacteroidales bacterium]
MELRRVVVTGIGAVTPIGNDVTDFWNSLLTGTNGVGMITHFDTTEYKTKFACELKGFDVSKYMDPKEARKVDVCTHYAVAAAVEAMTDAGLSHGTYNPERAGVVVGAGIGGVATTALDIIDFALDNQRPRFSPFFLLKSLNNMMSGNLSIRFDLQGPSFVTSSACTSAAAALWDARNMIGLGLCDIMLTGGSEAGIVPFGIGGFNAMRALSTRNDDIYTASRPFSIGRDGFVMGEGSGMLVLEEYEHAVKRGAKIYAEIAGIGMTSDAYHVTHPRPDGAGARKAMELALKEGDVGIDMIPYVNTHGTSTPLGDASECAAIQALFGDHADTMLFNATKSMTGHLLGAGAAVECIATILEMQNNVVHPTINFEDPDPELPVWDFCIYGPVECDMEYALCNSFGFGGHNASILLKKV